MCRYCYLVTKFKVVKLITYFFFKLIFLTIIPYPFITNKNIDRPSSVFYYILIKK